jgi:TPR repeat protein
VEAQFRLGDFYALGHGTSKSISDAYKWYTISAIQGYKKALLRIHNLYQNDARVHCRGQINSEEEEWVSKKFKADNKVRELNEYRMEQKKSILNGAIDYYTDQFKYYQSCNQVDPIVQLNLGFLYQHGYGVKKCIKWAIEYYTLSAEQGNVNAQYNLGDIYEKHTGMKFNYREAFKWYTKSAQGGNRIAQRSLAFFYLKGLVTAINYDVALSWYTKAAEAGDSIAQVTLGKLYRKGDCIKQDLSMAVKWYMLAARQGNIAAQNCLSQLYQRDMLGDIDLDGDITEYTTYCSMNSRLSTKLSLNISKLGDLPNFKHLNELGRRTLIGDGPAMYEIGLRYLNGDKGFNKDQDTGIQWIKNSANAKHKDAQLMIANLYKHGSSVNQDYYKASIWYKTLATQKNSAAKCNVGVMYNEGLGVRNDPLEASKWFTWAADQKNSDAQFNLGMLKLQGRGLHQDEEEAVGWLYKSARQGNVYACYEFGDIYFEGRCQIEKDQKRGLKLIQFAAKNGSTQAQLKMARLYEKEKDIRNYVDYLSMAADSGSEKAQYTLAVLYLNGDDIDHDYIKAYDLLKRANYQGYENADIMTQIPIEYEVKIKNYGKVLEMFMEVTEKGIDDLSYHVGYFYEYGVRGIGKIHIHVSHKKARQWYLAASKRGDSRADYRLGIMYEFGKGIAKSLYRAIYYYEKSFIKGNYDAKYKLSCMYLDGHSVTRDLLNEFHYSTKESAMFHHKANEVLVFKSNLKPITEEKRLSMLEKATKKGLIRLEYQIGVWYEKNNDDRNALKWLTLASNIGVTDAYYRLGVFYERGRGTKQNYTAARNMYQKAAEKEHEDACYRLARLYQYGNGGKVDYLKAYQYFKKASGMGHVNAYKILNITLDNKRSLSGDLDESFFDPSLGIYRHSLLMCKYVAEDGNIEVQFQVGFAYEYSVSEPNYEEAYKWYSMAARESHVKAMYHLGLLYENGLGISRDYQKANHLYHQAGQFGSADALYQLGKAYHHGRNFAIDPIKAIECYHTTAELGNPEHQCELGRLYEEGELFPKSLLQALKWYTKAYLQGYDKISSKLYSIYENRPYEDFFFKKLFKNLSIASHGQFLLTDDYLEHDYRNLNNRLGAFCALGFPFKKNLEEAWDYFSRKYSNSSRTFSVDDVLLLKHGFTSNEKSDILKSLVEDEALLDRIINKEQLFKLGMIFFQGKYDTRGSIPIKKDYSTAFRCLKKAAHENHPQAMFQLAIMYHYGYGIERDSEQGDICFDNARKMDNTFEDHIALLYHTDIKIQNFTNAFTWYTRLEKRLDAISPLSKRREITSKVKLGLGLLYEYGDGVVQDYQKALEYYNSLADDNIGCGINRLAIMHYYGKGVSVDYNKSIDLFNASSDYLYSTKVPFVYEEEDPNDNNSSSHLRYCIASDEEIYAIDEYHLGLLYKNARGQRKDLEKSILHFRFAYQNRDERAKNELDDSDS